MSVGGNEGRTIANRRQCALATCHIESSRFARIPVTSEISLDEREISETLATAPLGPYQVQAAIAAVHDEAATADETDWRQILALYGVLERLSPNPMVTLNRAVALAMVDGPQAGLALLAFLDEDGRLAGHHRLDAVRAHLQEEAGNQAAAIASYQLAARRTTSLPEQRYLGERAERLLIHEGPA